MATVDNQWEIYIFKKNSPWGVIKHPQRGNVYKHIVWTHSNKKNEFINKELMPTGESFNNAEYEKYAYNPIDELSFTFKVNYRDLNGTYDEINNRDFCAVKKPDDTRIYFYTLQVRQAKVATVEFLAELDVFFTYLDNNLLSDTRESFVVQGHEKRYLADGTPDWNKVLKNTEPIVQINKLIKKHEIQYEYSVPKNFKLLIVYVKNEFLNGFQITNNIKTKSKDLQLPYTILIFPIHTNFKTVNLNFKELNYFLLRKLLMENDYILSAHVKDFHEIGSLLPWTSFNETDESISYGFISDDTKFAKVITVNSKIKETDDAKLKQLKESRSNCSSSTCRRALDELILERLKEINASAKTLNDPLIYISETQLINKINDTEKALIGKIYIDDMMARGLDDPIIYSPLYYKLEIKKWNQEGREYYFPRLIQKTDNNDKKYIEVKNLYSWEPTNDKNIYWMEYNKNYKDNIIEGDYLTLEHQNTIDSKQDTLKAYMRDNANAFNTNYNQQKAMAKLNRENAIIGSIFSAFGAVGSLASKNAIGTVGAGAGFVRSIQNIRSADLRIKHIEQTRKATIDDLRNRLPNVITGNSTHLNNQIDRITDNENIKVLEYGLNDATKKILLDNVKQYGYQVKEFKNIKTFIQTRKRYNYIECDDVFNDIVPNLSPRIKQTINDAFASGLYIWHYRSASQWKGIKNFTDNNDEV